VAFRGSGPGFRVEGLEVRGEGFEEGFAANLPEARAESPRVDNCFFGG